MFQVKPSVLRKLVIQRLHKNGYYAVESDDMETWSAIMDSKGAFVNPQFYPEIYGGREITLYNAKNDKFAGTIAWRYMESGDYVEDMVNGTAWLKAPDKLGWKGLDRGDFSETVSGRIHSRGGLLVEDEGHRLSWWLTSLQWTYAVEDNVDFVVSHASPANAGAKLPTRIFGYSHIQSFEPHYGPQFAGPVQAHFVWSDKDEVLAEVNARTVFLRQCKEPDLRYCAELYEKGMRQPPVPAEQERRLVAVS